MSGTLRFDAVLFDCDGVLVDSEPLTMGVLRDMLEERGWRMSLQDCMQIFVGKATKDEAHASNVKPASLSPPNGCTVSGRGAI